MRQVGTGSREEEEMDVGWREGEIEDVWGVKIGSDHLYGGLGSQ